MIIYRNFQYWSSFVLMVAAVLFSRLASAAFIVSGEQSCFGQNTYAYHFSESAIISDYTVKVNSTALISDITMQLVTDPKQADLILVDGFTEGNMKVCKKSSSIGMKTIKVSNSDVSPDITVKLSETSLFPDYKIFILSETFTKEEAAALFAVILKESRKK